MKVFSILIFLSSGLAFADYDSSFVHYCKTGQLSKAKEVLSKNPSSLNGVSGQWSCLPASLYNKKNKVAKWVISKGANVNQAGWPGTPLGLAVKNNNLEMIKILLEAGANFSKYPNYHTPGTFQRSGECWSGHSLGGIYKQCREMIILRGQVKALKLFLSNGFEVFPKDLYKALDEDRMAMAKLINEKIVDWSPYYNYINQHMPIAFLASLKGQNIILETVIQHSDVNKQPGKIRINDKVTWNAMPIAAAAVKNNLVILSKLLKQSSRLAPWGYFPIAADPIQAAAYFGSLEAIKLLVSDADIGSQLKDRRVRVQGGEMVGSIWGEFGYDALHISALKGNLEILKELISAGWDHKSKLSKQGQFDWIPTELTALDVAKKNNQVEVIRYLESLD